MNVGFESVCRAVLLVARQVISLLPPIVLMMRFPWLPKILVLETSAGKSRNWRDYIALLENYRSCFSSKYYSITIPALHKRSNN